MEKIILSFMIFNKI